MIPIGGNNPWAALDAECEQRRAAALPMEREETPSKKVSGTLIREFQTPFCLVFLNLATCRQERLDALLYQLDPQARPIGDGQETVFHIQFGRVVNDLKVLRDPVRIQLLDNEIWDASIQVKGRGRGDWAGTGMRLDPHVVRLGHGRNLLGFHDPAGVSDIGLKNVSCVQLQDSTKAIARVNPLAACNGNAYLVGDLFHRLNVKWIDRLLQKQDILIFHFP